MQEQQILVRLKTTTIKTKGFNQYGKCQICNEKYSQWCIEASLYNKHNVFIFCKDCFLEVNDICCKFVYNKTVYSYEIAYHINEKPIHNF